ncbi:unnamed protein product, partial [marine sediment metagenome]
EIGDKKGMASSLTNIGAIYNEDGEYALAIEYLLKSLEIKEVIDDKVGISDSYTAIAGSYFGLKEVKKAIDYGLKGLQMAQDIGSLDEEKSARYQLAYIFEESGDTDNALKHFKAYTAVKDSMRNEKNTREITERDMQYEFDKQQAKDMAEQEKKDAIAAEELKREKAIGYAFMGGFGLLLILAFLIFRNLRQKKRANRLISMQKEEVEYQKDMVEEKNREITDSITYALRIQEAILPPDRIVKEYLQESFILYKPKDIVAGDFYWMEVIGDTTIFAAADCTGHGVPGAMVSVVCHGALNRSVREFGLTDPAKILDKTRELVIETFEASDEEVKDGMDIALCSLTGTELQYAGAHNPLWVLRNGEVLETKADKQPIGKYAELKPFTT